MLWSGSTACHAPVIITQHKSRSAVRGVTDMLENSHGEFSWWIPHSLTLLQKKEFCITFVLQRQTWWLLHLRLWCLMAVITNVFTTAQGGYMTSRCSLSVNIVNIKLWAEFDLWKMLTEGQGTTHSILVIFQISDGLWSFKDQMVMIKAEELWSKLPFPELLLCNLVRLLPMYSNHMLPVRAHTHTHTHTLYIFCNSIL